MTSSKQYSQVYNNISRNSQQISYKPIIFAKQNASNSVNIFSKINLTNSDKKSQQIINKEISGKQTTNNLQLTQKESEKIPIIQVKLMYSDRQQNTLEQGECKKKQDKIKKMKQEQQLEKIKKIQELQHKKIESVNSKKDIKLQNRSGETKSQLTTNKHDTNQVLNVSAELRTQKNQALNAKKQKFENKLATIRQHSIQDSDVKPKNQIIQSIHTQRSGLTYFQNLSEQDPQSPLKSTSNIISNQKEIKPQFKMTDSLKLNNNNQIKQTSSHGVTSKTSNSLDYIKSKSILQKQDELKIKNAESESEYSDRTGQLSSSRIIQKDDSEKYQLTKSQIISRNKQNQNLQTQTPEMQNVSKQSRRNESVKQFILAPQNQKKKELFQNKVNQIRKSSQNQMQQQYQIPKKIQNNISFSPQYFLNQNQKPPSTKPKLQLKHGLNQKKQNSQHNPYSNRQNSLSNIPKGNIFQRASEATKKNIQNNTNKKIGQRKNIQSASSKRIQNCIQSSKDEQHLPCFNNIDGLKQVVTIQQKAQIRPILSKDEKNVSVLKDQQISRPAFKSNQKIQTQSSPNKQLDTGRISSNKQKVVNHYVDKNGILIQKILDMCKKKRQLLKKFTKFMQKSKFQDNFTFIPQNLFLNAHSFYILKDLSQKLKKNQKKEKIGQKLQNYLDLLVDLKKKVNIYSQPLTEHGNNKNFNIFSNSKYKIKINPVLPQEIQQRVQRILLKNRVRLRQNEVRLKKISQRQNILMNKINESQSDSSNQQIFLNDFAFGYVEEDKTKIKNNKLQKTINAETNKNEKLKRVQMRMSASLNVKSFPSINKWKSKNVKIVSRSQKMKNQLRRQKILQKIKIKQIKLKTFKIGNRRTLNKRQLQQEERQRVKYHLMKQSQNQFQKDTQINTQIEVDDSWQIDLVEDT